MYVSIKGMDGRDQKQSPGDMDMQLNLLPKERRNFCWREEGGVVGC